MKKLIAKTQESKEYLHSKSNAFFANANAQKIADILNKNQYKLSDGEKWYVYDYDYTQDFYVGYRIFIARNGHVKVATI
jgi:D-lyxose ketol-isomerase